MKNRWSDAARAAALAVRKARAFAANPRDKGKAEPRKGGLARKPSPMVYAGGSATFDETAGRHVPEKNIWIPPPDHPLWKDAKFVESFKKGVAERKKNPAPSAGAIPKPNIFYSSTGPRGPLDRQPQQGILRYDPKNPLDPSELGYNTGKPKTKTMPPKRPTGKTVPRVESGRVIIGGRRYTRVGNKLVPDEVIPGKKTKVFYEKV